MSRLVSAFRLVGIDLPRVKISAHGLVKFYSDLRRFKALQAQSRSRIKFGKLYPCIDDRGAESGMAAGHYFHQDLVAAQRIFAVQTRRGRSTSSGGRWPHCT